MSTRFTGRKTIAEVVAEMSPVHPEIASKSHWGRLRILAFKQERILQLWEQDGAGTWTLFRSWPFSGFSGTLGPKLREGDRQIPEGIYRVVSLNPNSRYHLSVELNYPNAFDRKWAEHDGRTQPGGDIFLHGKSVTVGCIPIGDPAIEELFLTLALAGFDEVDVIIAPVDFRHHPPPEIPSSPEWLEEKYVLIREQLEVMPVSP